MRVDLCLMVRGRALLAYAVAAVACLTLSPLAAEASQTSSATNATTALDAGVLVQLNQIRRDHQLQPLTLNPALSRAALSHTQEMVAKGYFQHDSADGEPFWKRIEVYYPEGSSTFWAVGENLFWSSGLATSAESMQAWMASPPHRANILDPRWREIGIAAVNAQAPGTYGGLDVTVVTTDFGVRR
jgi:uncharacterized protein YkwD